MLSKIWDVLKSLLALWGEYLERQNRRTMDKEAQIEQKAEELETEVRKELVKGGGTADAYRAAFNRVRDAQQGRN